MAEKLGMKSMDKVEENVKILAKLFPNIVKESSKIGGGGTEFNRF